MEALRHKVVESIHVTINSIQMLVYEKKGYIYDSEKHCMTLRLLGNFKFCCLQTVGLMLSQGKRRAGKKRIVESYNH